MRDAEDVLSLRHLGAEGDPLLHLHLLGLLVRLGVRFACSQQLTACIHGGHNTCEDDENGVLSTDAKTGLSISAAFSHFCLCQVP